MEMVVELINHSNRISEPCLVAGGDPSSWEKLGGMRLKGVVLTVTTVSTLPLFLFYWIWQQGSSHLQCSRERQSVDLNNPSLKLNSQGLSSLPWNKTSGALGGI